MHFRVHCYRTPYVSIRQTSNISCAAPGEGGGWRPIVLVQDREDVEPAATLLHVDARRGRTQPELGLLRP